MMTADRTFYSWATQQNEDGTFNAVVTTTSQTAPRPVELKRVICASRARAKTNAVQWCRFLIADHNKNGITSARKKAGA